MGEGTRPVNRAPEAIRSDIAQTQARLDATLKEIEARLAPRRVVERAREAAEERLRRTAGRAGAHGRALVRRVDDMGRARVIGGAADVVAAALATRRRLARRRAAAESAAVPAHADWERPFLQSSPDGHGRNGRAAWVAAGVLLGAAALLLARRVPALGPAAPPQPPILPASQHMVAPAEIQP